MKQRLDMGAASPGAYKAMRALSDYTRDCGLEPRLLELVKTRASQLNGCAFCLHMHSRDARKGGETQERLDLLPAWREAPVYTERERAALAWTDALTLLTDGHAPDSVYEEVRAQFSEAEVANLSLAIATINAWNRLAVGMRFIPKV